MSHRILIVDDQEDNLESIRSGFSRLPYEVVSAVGGKAALETIATEEPFDVVLTDLKMPDADGLEVLRAAQDRSPATAVILLTAYGTVEKAVEALREGAWHFLTKPVGLEELRREVKKALERSDLIRSNENLRRTVDEKYGFEGIIGKSEVLHRVFERVRLVADTRATVLVEGESGTGKELFSKAIHFNSDRNRKPFVAVHCAALAETLLESELFGHEKGSFTGAIGRKPGRFELADGGTLFLDEIGEIPLSIQVKLLRFLESREFNRVGGVDTIKVDVRVIAATNRNLETEVRDGRFREDLYYRLKVIQLMLPPLRDRREDIPLLVDYFLDQLSSEHGRAHPEITKGALARLTGFAWPGNIRQLRNTLESMLLFCRDSRIDVADLPAQLGGIGETSSEIIVEKGSSLEEIQGRMILKTLEETGQNRTEAAKILGISRRTLQRKLRELGVERDAGSS